MTPTGRKLLERVGMTKDGPMTEEELRHRVTRLQEAEAIAFLRSLGYAVTPPDRLKALPPLDLKTSSP